MAREANGEKIVRNAIANMEAEGFRVSAKTRKNCMDIVEGKKTARSVVDERVRYYQKRSKV